MSLQDVLARAIQQLQAANIPTARLDCLILLEDTLGINRASILAHPERNVTAAEQQHFMEMVDKRASHTPLAYIRGKAMFYGREFIVSEHVLVPRPETESIIEFLKKLPLDRAVIADIGTGSGCIGITAALELPSSSVTLYDIDTYALAIALKNSMRLGATNVACAPLNVLETLPEACDVILANLPYVPENYPVNQAATREPKLALFSGPDGLDHYRAFWHLTGQLAKKPHYIITESLPSQHHALAQLARNQGYALEQHDDFVQLFSL